ncbi:MAG: TonB-dependent receptor plug domain-containing protein [Bacteroidales bacterium]|nr:TonB-dependent receptor plug domain-containing protein [Bacteroidales bacterium]MBN2634523.1 TonB-dependent receptor plug domain-containing protein [Bacteroidales bacterium]
MRTIVIFLFISIHLSLIRNYDASAQSQLAEKVYLHIDRNMYETGDDIWFKAYVIDALTNNLSPNTNNLHVELISPGAQIIASRTVRILNGLGNGDFSLPGSLPSGRYRIRAYTNFMRNFDEAFFFNREIIIINPEDNGNGLSDSTIYIEDQIYIKFFPEGGSLIDSVPSIVAFKATDAAGKGCDVTGKVYSSSGNLITSFESFHRGMGYFILRPAHGLDYYAVFEGHDGIGYRAPIPGSFSAGFTLHSSVMPENRLLVRIQTNESTYNNLDEKDLLIRFSSRNLLNKMLQVKADKPVNNYIIPVGDFPEGIIRITLLTIDELPLCERLVYYEKNPDLTVGIYTDKQQYKTREPINVTVRPEGENKNLIRSHLSLSAAEKASITDQESSATSISSWFLLESDVHGEIEDPTWYFNHSNIMRFQNLDLLLMTQGWRDFRWKYQDNATFSHEIGFTISGAVKRNSRNKPFPGAKINIAVFDEKASLFLTTMADSSGIFKVGGVEINGKARILASVATKEERLFGWIYLDSIYYSPAGVSFEIADRIVLMPSRYSMVREEAILQNSIRKKYRLSDTIDIGEVVIVGRSPVTAQTSRIVSGRTMYGKPDHELIITPAMQLYPDIFQVIAGRIPGVEIHPDLGLVTVRGQIPLVLRDGIPMSDPTEIGNIPPSQIDRIDVLKWSSPFGSRGANGIINIITRSGDYNYDAAANLTHTASMNVRGFDEPRIFYSQVHSSANPDESMPDTRRTLHWEPDITINPGSDCKIRFFNSDKNSEIVLTVEGMTDNGIPVSARIQVNRNK